MPVTGGTCEMIFIPVCADTTELTGRIEDGISKVKMLEGVSYNIDIGYRLFSEVFNKAQKIKLQTSKDMASQYKVVYACPVYASFTNAENDTKSIVGGNENSSHENFIFESYQKLNIEYYFTNSIKVDSLRVL
jgi:hypothetical protein